jgi:hypothetical protein
MDGYKNPKRKNVLNKKGYEIKIQKYGRNGKFAWWYTKIWGRKGPTSRMISGRCNLDEINSSFEEIMNNPREGLYNISPEDFKKFQMMDDNIFEPQREA